MSEIRKVLSIMVAFGAVACDPPTPDEQPPRDVPAQEWPYRPDRTRVYRAREAASTMVHAVGVYEGRPAPGRDDSPWWAHCDAYATQADCFEAEAKKHDVRYVDVTVKATAAPIVLLLTSYEPEVWQVRLEPGAQVSRVVTSGYYEQVVTGVPAARVERLEVEAEDYEPLHTYGSADEHFEEGYDALSARVGAPITTFQGAYSGDRFVVPPAD